MADQGGLGLLERYAHHGVKERLVRVQIRFPTYVFGMSKDWEDVTCFLIHRFPADDDP